ncbi:MAG: hypothetical protein LBP96_05550, partial [Bacteroidales bacterium]|nr:hypothetical protein [Bacteroidales bacterium]
MNIGKHKIIFIAIMLFSVQLFAQTNCLMFDMSNREPAFRSGEKITYTINHSIAGSVGEVVFKTTLREEGVSRP